MIWLVLILSFVRYSLAIGAVMVLAIFALAPLLPMGPWRFALLGCGATIYALAMAVLVSIWLRDRQS